MQISEETWRTTVTKLKKKINSANRDTKHLEFLCNLFFYLNLICSREVLIHLPASSVANESPAQFYRAGHLLHCWLMHHVYLQGNAQKELNVMVEPTWIRKQTDKLESECNLDISAKEYQAVKLGKKELHHQWSNVTKISTKEFEVMAD